MKQSAVLLDGVNKHQHAIVRISSFRLIYSRDQYCDSIPDRSDRVVGRASASEAVVAGSITVWVSGQTKDSRKVIFTGSLKMMLDAQQDRGCVETKPANFLVTLERH